MQKDRPVVIIGAGPAGLTAAYELNKLRKKSVLFEASDKIGGISQTVNFKGNRFDIGGHRFFSKVEYVNQIWDEILEKDFLTCERLSRIYYNGKYFDYPLKPLNALKRLGPLETIRVAFSYGKTILFPSGQEELTFEDWIVNRFGRRLFEIFFKTYTEKVWGMPCNQISSDWAAQRIKNLSLKTAIYNAISSSNGSNGEIVTSLIERFKYPRLGPGMMWERCRDFLEDQDIPTFEEHCIIQIKIKDNLVSHVVAKKNDGSEKSIEGPDYISSIPLRELILSLEPSPSKRIVNAAKALRYRDYLTVVLVVNKKEVFPDNWIYIHSPEVKLGRIQNYKNWSAEMVENQNHSTLGLEYFFWEHDSEWSWSDERLIEMGINECRQIGIIGEEEVLDATVVRMKKAYPVYDQDYADNLKIIKNYINSIPNLQTIGRNGQHRYNNQDHSMMTAVYAARNITGSNYDVWSVNVEKDYHESASPSKGNDRLIPSVIKTKSEINDEDEVFNELFISLDPVSLGGAIGITCGLLLSLTTIIVIIIGDEESRIILGLLNNFLWAFEVSWKGVIVGFIEMLIIGYIIGYLLAWLRNKCFHIFVLDWYRQYTRHVNQDIIDKI